jgi:phosphoglycolate phosphatase
MKPLEVIRELGVPFHKVPLYLNETQALLATKADEIKLFKGMKPLLKKLKRYYTIGIITTSKSDLISNVLQKNNVNLIDFVFSGSSIFGKQAVLQELIRKHGLKKEETVYIGDEVRDVEASKKAGIKVIAVTWGYNSRKALETAKADIVVDKPAELIKAINSL